jgi:RES domain-containing protein
MLEYFVHLDSDSAPADLVLVSAEIPDDLSRERIGAQELPSFWRKSPAPVELARIGDEFVQRAKQCILIVPSALAPNENNWLLNPQHPGFRRIVLSELEPLRYDPRMFGRQRGRRRPKNT